MFALQRLENKAIMLLILTWWDSASVAGGPDMSGDWQSSELCSM